MSNFYDYLSNEAINTLKLPEYFKKALKGDMINLLKKVLRMNVLITRKYTNKRVFE